MSSSPSTVQHGHGYLSPAPIPVIQNALVSERWSYIDARGSVQGMFDHEQIIAWVTQGHFCSRTFARRESENVFRTLKSHGLFQKEANDDTRDIREMESWRLGNCWFYIDSNGVEQGPFDLHKMREWSPRFFDGATLVRCGESSTEFVQLRTTVIAQKLDDPAFSNGGFFGSSEEDNNNDGNTSSGKGEPKSAPSGANGISDSTRSSNASVLTNDHQEQQQGNYRLQSASQQLIAAAEERAKVAEECVTASQRELAAAQERYIAIQKKNKDLESKIEDITQSLSQKETAEQELLSHIESLNIEVERLQVFEVAFGMMQEGIDLIQSGQKNKSNKQSGSLSSKILKNTTGRMVSGTSKNSKKAKRTSNASKGK